MPSYRDLYPALWLKPDVIGRNRVRVMVERVTRESLFNPTTKKNEDKLIAKFRGKELRLILNKTSCLALENIFNTDDFSRWHSREIVLSTTKASNGKDTIVISAPSGHEKTSAPQSEADPAQGNPFDDDGEDTDLDEQGDVNYYASKPTDTSMHGQAPSGARSETPDDKGLHGQGDQLARPVNNGAEPCHSCHAPVGRPHATSCPVALHGQPILAEGRVARSEIADTRPADLVARSQQVLDPEEDLHRRLAAIYQSNIPLSKYASEVIRKCRNADHDSAMKMSWKYVEAIVTTLREHLGGDAMTADMILTALLGYRVTEQKRPGQSVHGYLIRPLRERDEAFGAAIDEIMELVVEIWIEDEMAEGQADGNN